MYNDIFLKYTLKNILLPEKEQLLINDLENLPIGHWKRILYLINLVNQTQSQSQSQSKSQSQEIFKNSKSSNSDKVIVLKNFIFNIEIR